MQIMIVKRKSHVLERKKHEFRLENRVTSEPALFIHLLSQSYVFEVSRPLFFCKISVFFDFSWFSQKIRLDKCIQIMIQRRHSRVFLRKNLDFDSRELKSSRNWQPPLFHTPIVQKLCFWGVATFSFLVKFCFFECLWFFKKVGCARCM